MLVLQDFEALRPNLLARTIETVQGGGMICILLKTMSSLKQLYTLTMVCVLAPLLMSGRPFPLSHRCA
jgi:tRNA(Met) C34 N-acetyltransferase TmcA